MTLQLLNLVKRIVLEMTKFSSRSFANSCQSAAGRVRMGMRPLKPLLPAPLFAIAIVVGKCESHEHRPCSEFFGTRLSSCPPNSTKEMSCFISKMSKSLQSCSKTEGSSVASLLGVDVNASQSKKNEPEELTHHFLLKQAATVTIDSVTRLLTETVSTLEDYHHQYRQMLNLLVDFLEQSRVANEASQELLTCRMIVLRSQMEDVKRNIQEVESLLSSVESLTNQAALVAYLTRAEYPSVALSERLQSAMIEVNRIQTETKELESDMVQLQALLIVESGKSLK